VIDLSASVLAADFSRLGADLREAFAAGACGAHVDVMDGQFVPNLSMGPEVLRAVRRVADEAAAKVTVHLMIVQPERFLELFVEAGAQRLVVHLEHTHLLMRTLARIRELGAEAAVAINPATPLGLLEEVLPQLSSVLVMSVDPGFGGQRFQPSSVRKIERLRRMLATAQLGHVQIAVDGGINTDTIGAVVRAGADAAVAGSAIFNAHASIADNVRALALAAGAAAPGGARGRSREKIMQEAIRATTRLFLVRHGATARTAEDRFSGDVGVDLSEEGRAQVRALAERLRPRPIDAVYASPLSRTRETAEILAAGRALTVATRDGLREIHHGHWEGLSRREVEEQFPEEYSAWEQDPFNSAPEGGEPGVSVLARALPVVREIVVAHPGQTVLVVSHKATIRLLLASFLGFDLRGYRDRLDQAPACLNVIEFKDAVRARLMLFNDVSHYASEPRRPQTNLSRWWDAPR
jgi:probable phosphoglycerate mutase